MRFLIVYCTTFGDPQSWNSHLKSLGVQSTLHYPKSYLHANSNIWEHKGERILSCFYTINYGNRSHDGDSLSATQCCGKFALICSREHSVKNVFVPGCPLSIFALPHVILVRPHNMIAKLVAYPTAHRFSRSFLLLSFERRNIAKF